VQDEYVYQRGYPFGNRVNSFCPFLSITRSVSRIAPCGLATHNVVDSREVVARLEVAVNDTSGAAAL